jgi:hypothetical protein
MTAISDQNAVVVAERSSNLTEADLNQIEALVQENESETYRGRCWRWWMRCGGCGRWCSVTWRRRRGCCSAIHLSDVTLL